MEVKDVNNSLSQLLFNKNASAGASQQVSGAGFANLLGQTSMVLDMMSGRSSSEKVQVDVSASKKTASVENKNTPASKEKKVAPKEKSVPAEKNVAKKSKKTVAEDASVSASQTNVVEDKTAPRDNVVANADVQPEKNAAQENVFGSEGETYSDVESLSVQPNENSEPLLKELSIMPALQGNNENFVASLSGDNVYLWPEMPELAQLASLDQVFVLDSATGEIKAMTGAELLEKVKTASASGNLFVSGDVSGSMVEMKPASIVNVAENVQSVAEESAVVPDNGEQNSENLVLRAPSEEIVENVNDVPVETEFAKTEDVVPDDVKKNTGNNNKVSAHNVKEFAYVDESLRDQAAVLDEKVSLGHKLKVDVVVNEEKNAAAVSTSDLLQDEFSLRDIWGEAKVSENVGDKQSAQNGVSSQPSLAVQNNAMPDRNSFAAVMPVAAAAVEVLDAAVYSISSSASAADVSSAPLSSVIAAGGETAGQLRAETAKTSETSFRDIFKGMEKEVVDQVKVNITKSAVKGIDKINIQLKPEDLGHIEIKMQISKGGKLQAHIISSRPETMEILQKEIQSLEQAFNDAGFETEDGSLSFSFREGNQAGQDSNSELRSFLGNVFETEASVENAGNDNLENWNPAQGLNIRV